MSARPAVGGSHATEALQPPDVLLVDDDPAIRNMVTRYFAEHDMPARAASGAEEMERCLLRPPALIILDLRLGQENGLDLLRALRARSDIPVIIVTGHRLEEIDRVVGLELGADDYMTKPFGLRELLARVHAILRRQRRAREAPRETGREAPGAAYEFGGWRLVCDSRQLVDPAGQPLVLTHGEYSLLVAFLEAPQRPLTREQLLAATRVHEDIFDRSIDVQVLRLRRKLEADASAPRIIVTERGVGYTFALPVRRLW